MDNSLEKDKWDRIYSSQREFHEDETLRDFNLEFSDLVTQLLPNGGRTLEVGSGMGWQSLALARIGIFSTTLLDFSKNAIEVSRELFSREHKDATFLLEDAFTHGAPEFELVFNAGVLEHYTVHQQKALLQAMSSRSRRYVMVLVPNADCYWYWIWRNYYSSRGQWEFGKEIPLTDLSLLFQDAGLKFIGQKYLGNSWTESFINNLGGISEPLRQLLLLTHRSSGLAPAQTGYLLAGLGLKPECEVENLPAWKSDLPLDRQLVSELSSSIAELTSLQIQATNRTNEALAREKDLYSAQLSAMQLQHETEKLELGKDFSALKQVVADFAAKVVDYETTIENNRGQLENYQIQLENQASEFANGLASRDQTIELLIKTNGENELKIIELQQSYSSTLQLLQQIHSSRAWRLVRLLWKVRVALAPPNSRRAKMLGGALRFGKKQVYKNPAPVFSPTKSLPLLPDHLNRYVTSLSDTRVLLITRVFFDPSGNNMQFGGAERYLLELAKVLWSIGYDPVVLQCGNDHWLRYYDNLPVVGIRVGENYDSFISQVENLAPQAALAIYSPFELFSAKISIPSFGISHGVYWDSVDYQKDNDTLLATINRLKEKISQLDALISVDTNTLNWLRTVDLELSKKGIYIPNFVDMDQFSSRRTLSSHDEGERLIVLFPRRLVHQRGFWLVCQVLQEILEKYPNVDFHFVGKAAPTEQSQISELIKAHPKRVFWYFLPPEEMHRAYEKSAITLIPTVQSEGTSLSCLEALAAGHAVIATNVGGLPDLIIHEHNGLLIEPNAKELKIALERLITDPDLRNRFGKNGQEVAQNFSLEKWKSRWKIALNKILPEVERVGGVKYVKGLVFPFGYGIHWHGVKQRPHHMAVQFIRQGYEVFWYTPEGRQPDPIPGLHLIGRSDELYLDRPVVLIYYPQSYLELGRFKNPIVVYDVLDDISIHDTAGTEETARLARECHEKLLERADLVIASSRLLVKQLSKRCSDVLYVPNAVDIEHFSPDNCVPDGGTKKRPVIGYHGAIATWFDGELVAETARLRPQYDFVMIGPVSDGEAEKSLNSQPNIIQTGALPYEDLPDRLCNFDVGIMPFKLSKLTHAVRPLKILEYLAMKKPVVATPMQEILDWPGVRFAQQAEDFAHQIDSALANGFIDDGTISSFVQESTWSKVIKLLNDRLQQIVGM